MAVRVVGAILLLFVGADHYYEYSVDQYSVLPTIGTLFLLNFLSASILGLMLLTPLERIAGRFARAAIGLVAAGGFAVAATSLVALLISEQTRLFGFMELNYRPAILVAIGSEAAAALCLAILAILTLRAIERERPSATVVAMVRPRGPRDGARNGAATSASSRLVRSVEDSDAA
jgi:hypothetical protein